MPYLQIQTNIDIKPKQQADLLKSASKIVAKLLNKSENYVMVALQSKTSMLFAGTEQPTAFLVLKSLRLPVENTPYFSQTLCSFIEKQLNIQIDRIYIEFINPEPSLWGWNGRTF
jgi:phenylpyruvate tautomerase PptA (4-oxalocrotonate tautomerase family)